jgi:Uma2 family endonuclease
MPSPVKLPHATAHSLIVTWLGIYAARTPGTMLLDNATTRLDADNIFQPDAALRRTEGGTSRAGEDGYLDGPPELVVELASSSAAIDLHAKRHVYRRSGVQEYVVWLIREERLLWLALREGEYEPLEPDAEGLIRSRAFAGLRLAVPALLAGDLAAVLAAGAAA